MYWHVCLHYRDTFKAPNKKTCLWRFSWEQHQPSTYLTKFRIQQLLVSNSHDISITSCLCLIDFLIPHLCPTKILCFQYWNKVLQSKVKFSFALIWSALPRLITSSPFHRLRHKFSSFLSVFDVVYSVISASNTLNSILMVLSLCCS